MKPRRSKRVIIFEGPDGGGKTTAAKLLAEDMGAEYIHFDSFPNAKFLPPFFAQAMLPAVLGYNHVVMDRAWLSDPPYGKVFRKGQDRVGRANQRMLERLALRCGAVVIRCLPPLEKALESFRSRKGEEMLDTEKQLEQVYNLYRDEMRTDLPVIEYDYTKGPISDLSEQMTALSSLPHPTNRASAGVWDASIAIVAEDFAHHKDGDLLYQWPFASFSAQGCSKWLTDHLEKAGISEDLLFWVNADQDLGCLGGISQVYALGTKARERLTELGIEHEHVDHPQAWKRFNAKEEYPLGALIRQHLGA